MTNNRSTKNEGIQANNIKADVIAVGAGATANQTNYAAPSSDAQAALEKLVADLKTALAQVPPDKQGDAQAVELLSDELLTTSNQEKPNPKVLEIKGEGLKKAAENLASVAPIVLQIAGQIVAHILTTPH